jgi:hypothetical protein
MAVGAMDLDPDNRIHLKTLRPLRVCAVGEDHSARPKSIVVVEVKGEGRSITTLEADVDIIGLNTGREGDSESRAGGFLVTPIIDAARCIRTIPYTAAAGVTNRGAGLGVASLTLLQAIGSHTRCSTI